MFLRRQGRRLRRRPRPEAVLVCLLGGCWWVLALGFPATAAPMDPPDPFDTGVELTRQGHFEDALNWFEIARQQGDDSAHLHFNLGVVHYRLGRYEDARRAFEQAARDPEMAMLARYNLGLVAQAAGDETAAHDWFQWVAQHAGDGTLRRLARNALGLSTATPPPLQAGLQVLRGQDSNVIVPVGALSDAPTRTRDDYWDVRAGLSGGFGTWAPRLEYHLGALLMAYDELEAGDLGAIELGLHWRGPVLVELNTGALAVGDHGYQRNLDLRLQTTLWEIGNGALDLLAQVSRLDALSTAAERLEGYQYGAGLGYEHRWERTRMAARYRRLENDREDRALSPPQDLLEVRALTRWHRWSLRAWTRFVHSRYEAGRRDRAQDFGIAAAFALRRCCEVLLEWNRLENDSTETPFSYTSRRLGAGLRFQF